MRKLFVAALAAFALASCQRVEIAESGDMGGVISDSYSKKFTFTLKGDFINPEFTRANAYMTADGSEMTDLWVVDYVTSADAEGKVVQTLHQTKEDADWGAPTMSLTLGTHHVLFLASRGQGAQYQDGVVTWTKPLDAFYCDYEVTVVKTSNGNRAVTLDRVATKMLLVVEDAIPTGTTTISLQPTKLYTGWNMLTGEPVAAPNDYNVVLNIPTAWGGVSGRSLTAWSLSGSEEWNTDIAIESRAGDVVNASATIKDAPFVANRTTVYRGNLYTNAENSSLSLNAQWLQDYEGVY